MLKRLPYHDAPAALQQLIVELQQQGDTLVVEDEQHQPIACLAPLSPADHTRRAAGARHLRAHLETVPPSPYSEEETYHLIDEAISAIRAQDRKP